VRRRLRRELAGLTHEEWCEVVANLGRAAGLMLACLAVVVALYVLG